MDLYRQCFAYGWEFKVERYKRRRDGGRGRLFPKMDDYLRGR